MIPLALVTGFLGSGKTTLLHRLIDRYRDRKIAYLVNEFSHVDVDGGRLAERADLVAFLPGGSIFCTCLVHEFISTLEWIAGADGGAPDGVVIEASGVASPAVIAQLLRDTRMDAQYQLTCVLSVVDPGTFPVLVQSLPNIATQVEASDWVLINKADLHKEETLAAVEAQVRALNATAAIERTRFCDVNLDLFQPVHTPACARCGGTLASCRDPHFVKYDLVPPGVVDLETLRREAEALEQELYRMKGHVDTPGGLMYVDYSSAGFRAEPVASCRQKPGLIFIARGECHDNVRALVRRIKAGELGA